MTSQSPPAAPPKSPETIRAEIEADPQTKAIALAMGLPLDEYVDRVMHYILHPDAKPNLEVIADELAMKKGAATLTEVREWLELLQSGAFDDDESTKSDGFDSGGSGKPRVNLSGE